MGSEPRWYVVQSSSSSERIVVEQLERASFAHFFPHKPEAVRGQTVWRGRFPTYVFVRLDLELSPCWQGINSMRGVFRMLPHHTERPSPLPVGFVEELLELYRDGPPEEEDEVDRIVRSYARGDQIRIESGPFEGFTGRYSRRVKGQLELVVSLLGRETPLCVPAHQTSKACPSGPPGDRITRTTATRSPMYGRMRSHRAPSPEADQELSRVLS